jgi:hypothetical protein
LLSLRIEISLIGTVMILLFLAQMCFYWGFSTG